MAAEHKQKLEQQLWNIANTLRGKMDADDFRDYILGFIFYKYLSTKMGLYANTILQPDGLKFDQVPGHADETLLMHEIKQSNNYNQHPSRNVSQIHNQRSQLML